MFNLLLFNMNISFLLNFFCFLRWEAERLQMEKADLEDKWRDLQQTKLSKENQRTLGETEHTSSSQEFAGLDRTNKQVQ